MGVGLYVLLVGFNEYEYFLECDIECVELFGYLLQLVYEEGKDLLVLEYFGKVLVLLIFHCFFLHPKILSSYEIRQLILMQVDYNAIAMVG